MAGVHHLARRERVRTGSRLARRQPGPHGISYRCSKRVVRAAVFLPWCYWTHAATEITGCLPYMRNCGLSVSRYRMIS